MRACIIVFGIITVLLAGCGLSKDSPTAYADMPPSSLHPKSGMAQLIFYYPHSFFWRDMIADIKLNGTCNLKSGSFFIKDISPNPQTAIIVSQCGGFGLSQLTIKTLANTKYYVRITPTYDGTVTGLIAGYNLAKPVQTSFQLTPSQDPSPTNGPFTIDIMDEPSAIKELQSLTKCTKCS